MKKILLIDPLSPKGHKDINIIFLNLLENKFSITYISSEDYVDKKFGDNVKFIEIDKALFINGSSIANRYRYLKILYKISQILNNNYFDSVIFLSYDTISFSIFSFLNKNKIENTWGDIFLLNHLNIDEIKNSCIKRSLFYLIPKKIKHLCYEDYITETVINEFKRNAITIRHNLNFYKIVEVHNKEIDELIKNWFKNEYINLVALSNNKIDKKLLEDIVSLDKMNYFQEKKIRLLIKNRNFEYEGTNIKMFTSFLSEAEYCFCMNNCDYVFLPYQASKYDMRISGVFFDSITFNKPIICANTKFFEFIFRKFGDAGYKYTTNEDLLEIFLKLETQSFEFHQDVIDKIKEYYNDNNVRIELENLLNS